MTANYFITIRDDQGERLTYQEVSKASRPGVAVDRTLSRFMRNGGYQPQLPLDLRTITITVKRVRG